MGVLAPGGNQEMVGRENKSNYQKGVCGPAWICTKFVVSQTVRALCKHGPQNPALEAFSSHEIKMNS